MAENRKNSLEILPDGTLVRSKIDEFAQEDLVNCGVCDRKNSPERESCIYCGGLLNSDSVIHADFNCTNPEPWETCFNLIVRRINKDASRSDVNVPLKFLGTDFFERLIAESTPLGLPLYRAVDPDIVSSRADQLCSAGLDAFVMNDLELDMDRPPRRLRKIDFMVNKIVFEDFNTGFQTSASFNDLVVAVVGTLFCSKEEKRSRKRRDDWPEVTLIESDRNVLDLYLRDDPIGFRVEINGFDFSGLGQDRSLIGSENFSRLADRIADRAPACLFERSYGSVKDLLSKIWAEESEKDHQGIKRVGLDRIGRTVTLSLSNERQFTRYSRLQYFSL